MPLSTNDRLGPYLLGPNDDENCGIYTGDCRDLAKAIPDESVDLMFTDPVYDRIDDYRWLAKMTMRVLAIDCALLCWSNGRWHRKNSLWLEEAGLTYRYEFAVFRLDNSPLFGHIIAACNRLLWHDCQGRSRQIDYLVDGYGSLSPNAMSQAYRDLSLGAHGHWSKSIAFCRNAIRAFTLPASVILDPFTGEGTIPAVCKMLGRRYLAFEIMPDVAEMARERVRNTQPPLPFVHQPQQMTIDM